MPQRMGTQAGQRWNEGTLQSRGHRDSIAACGVLKCHNENEGEEHKFNAVADRVAEGFVDEFPLDNQSGEPHRQVDYS